MNDSLEHIITELHALRDSRLEIGSDLHLLADLVCQFALEVQPSGTRTK